MIYTLTHKRVPVVDIDINTALGMIVDIHDVHNVEHIPVGIAIKKGVPDLGGLNRWWIGRSIPASRSGIRDALQVLNMYSTSVLLEKCFGLGLSDQYWINDPRKPLEWIGPAPIYDCGTSMWHNKFTHKIDPFSQIESKPFRSNHSEQIKLVGDFDWINFSALENIDEEFLDIYKVSEYIDEERQRTLLFSLKRRVELLKLKAS